MVQKRENGENRTALLAQKKRDGGRERALSSMVPEVARYETVFLGFPIWGETVPPVIRASCPRTTCQARC